MSLLYPACVYVDEEDDDSAAEEEPETKKTKKQQDSEKTANTKVKNSINYPLNLAINPPPINPLCCCSSLIAWR